MDDEKNFFSGLCDYDTIREKIHGLLRISCIRQIGIVKE